MGHLLKLKPWHWAGIIVGVAYLCIYMFVFNVSIQIHGESGAAYLLLFLSIPFWIVFIPFPLMGMAIIGTIFYSLIGVVLGWVVSQIMAVVGLIPALSGDRLRSQDSMKLWKILGIAFGVIHLGVCLAVVVIYGEKSYGIIRSIEFGDPYSGKYGFMIMVGVVMSVFYGSLVMLIGRFTPIMSKDFYRSKRK